MQMLNTCMRCYDKCNQEYAMLCRMACVQDECTDNTCYVPSALILCIRGNAQIVDLCVPVRICLLAFVDAAGVLATRLASRQAKATLNNMMSDA